MCVCSFVCDHLEHKGHICFVRWCAVERGCLGPVESCSKSNQLWRTRTEEESRSSSRASHDRWPNCCSQVGWRVAHPRLPWYRHTQTPHIVQLGHALAFNSTIRRVLFHSQEFDRLFRQAKLSRRDENHKHVNSRFIVNTVFRAFVCKSQLIDCFDISWPVYRFNSRSASDKT